MTLASFMKGQNVSELLFEQYLAEQGLGKADHHPEFPGTTKRVDYRLLHNGRYMWFEVKEFADDQGLFADRMPGEVRGRSYDPYKGIRNKINDAWKKFKDYDGECCSLVLFNERANLIDLSQADFVLGAMLGNIGYSIPIDIEKGGRAGPATQIFGEQGKMLNPYTHEPQNTTINAVITLERLQVGQREQRIRFTKEEMQEARPLSWEESFERRKSIPSDGDSVLRTIVYENPHAANPLPTDIFRGPFDVRWGFADGRIAPTVGDKLADLEKREQELDLHLGPLQRYMKRENERDLRN